MAGGPDLLALVHRIRDLRSAFLPPTDPTGSYSAAEYDRTAAFLLLAHAEAEWFVERRCLEVAAAAVAAWSADSAPRSTIVALAAFSHSGGKSALPDPGRAGPPQIREVVDEAKRTYSTVVDQNNGITEENLLRLLLPLGLREFQFPTGFLVDMNTFGSHRGDQAHVGVGARTPPDPGDARNLATRIVLGLRRLDRHLLRLKTE